MKYSIVFDQPVTPNKALIVWQWMQKIETLSFSETLVFCHLTREIGFKIK